MRTSRNTVRDEDRSTQKRPIIGLLLEDIDRQNYLTASISYLTSFSLLPSAFRLRFQVIIKTKIYKLDIILISSNYHVVKKHLWYDQYENGCNFFI